MSVSKKRFKVLLNFNRYADGKLLPFGRFVTQSIYGNPKFPKPATSLEALQLKLDHFEADLAEALHRDARVIARKNALREEIIKSWRILAADVECESGNDYEGMVSSGSELAPTEYAGEKPLGDSRIASIEQGVQRAVADQDRFSRQGRQPFISCAMANMDPELWPTMMIPNAKAPVVFDGLTPGIVYALQVRAFGRSDFNAWSDSATRMAI